MRAAFLLLLLANLGFYVWWRFSSPADNPADAMALAAQVAPEKLKVIRPGDLAKAPPPPAKKEKPAAEKPAAEKPPVAPTPPPQATACMEWGSFTLTDAPRAEKALEPLALGARLAQRRTEESAGYWVFMPPQGNRQAALRKAAELKQLGVQDFFIVQEEGAYRWALSLGVFRTEEAARARLGVLRAQGVRTAQVGTRDTVVPKVWLQVKGVDAALQARLREVAKQVEGSELRDCL